MGQLSTAEIAHAKAVCRQWQTTEDNPPEFETVFGKLKGEILEGGESLVNIVRRAEVLEGNTCLNLIELALHIENSAFDLYRTVAEQAEEGEGKDVFLSISKAEKGHMNRLIDAINQCE